MEINPNLLLKSCIFSEFDYASRAMALSQRAVGLDIKLSQPNKLSRSIDQIENEGLFHWGFIS